MSSIARQRLQEERKLWKQDHPFGFYAKPERKADGSMNIMKWECGIPGKAGTAWEAGIYRIWVEFSEDFPTRPPTCKFDPPLFHPNIFPSGTVCLSILNEEKDWAPTITVKQLLLGIQDLLDHPNLADPAQREAFVLCRDAKDKYQEKVKELAKAYAAMHNA